MNAFRIPGLLDFIYSVIFQTEHISEAGAVPVLRWRPGRRGGLHNELGLRDRARDRAVVNEQPHSGSDWHECWKLNLLRPFIIEVFLSDTSSSSSSSSFFHHYSLLSLALAFLMIDAHSVLSKALLLHLFTPIFLTFNSTSSNHLNLVALFLLRPPLLVCLPVTSLLSFHHSLLQHTQASTIFIYSTMSGDLNYCKFLVHFRFLITIFISCFTYLSQDFRV